MPLNVVLAVAFVLLCLQPGSSLATTEDDLLGYLIRHASSNPNELAKAVQSPYSGRRGDGDVLQRALANLERRLLGEDQPPARGGRLAKRKTAFWQPMGGPLPVETRFVSFGGQTNAGDEEAVPAGVIRAMRYGRKR